MSSGIVDGLEIVQIHHQQGTVDRAVLGIQKLKDGFGGCLLVQYIGKSVMNA